MSFDLALFFPTSIPTELMISGCVSHICCWCSIVCVQLGIQRCTIFQHRHSILDGNLLMSQVFSCETHFQWSHAQPTRPELLRVLAVQATRAHYRSTLARKRGVELALVCQCSCSSYCSGHVPFQFCWCSNLFVQLRLLWDTVVQHWNADMEWNLFRCVCVLWGMRLSIFVHLYLCAGCVSTVQDVVSQVI